jgi:hypothetical protein
MQKNKWEVSISVFISEKGKRYKVTRRLPELYVAETKMFRDRNKAKKLFDAWLE